MWVGGPAATRSAELALDREISMIGTALDEHGPTDRRDLAAMVGARYWGPGRFSAALGEAIAKGRIRRLSRRVYGPSGDRPAGRPPMGDESPDGSAW